MGDQLTPGRVAAFIAAAGTRTRPAFETCPTCLAYAERRLPVLAPAMVAEMDRTGETSQQIVDRYMTAVHVRHLNQE
jgi:hypothetical protein